MPQKTCITGLTKEHADKVAALAKASKATDITNTLQTDGTYTVCYTLPDETS